jgi:hypothetical protein
LWVGLSSGSLLAGTIEGANQSGLGEKGIVTPRFRGGNSAFQSLDSNWSAMPLSSDIDTKPTGGVTVTRTKWIVVGVVVAVLLLAFILLASAGSNGGGSIPGY